MRGRWRRAYRLRRRLRLTNRSAPSSPIQIVLLGPVFVRAPRSQEQPPFPSLGVPPSPAPASRVTWVFVLVLLVVAMLVEAESVPVLLAVLMPVPAAV